MASTRGLGLFDTVTGERLARDREPDSGWPHERVLLSAGSPYTGGAHGETWWHIFHTRYSELRAAGFSPSGTTLVVATSSDINLWTRA